MIVQLAIRSCAVEMKFQTKHASVIARTNVTMPIRDGWEVCLRPRR